MDLSVFDSTRKAEEGSELHLRSPHGELLYIDDVERSRPVTLTLLGADSRSFQRRQHALVAQRINRRVGAGIQTMQIRPGELEEDRIELMVCATRSWTNVVIDGEEWPCDEKHVRDFYSRFPCFLEQADQFINDRANYLGN